MIFAKNLNFSIACLVLLLPGFLVAEQTYRTGGVTALDPQIQEELDNNADLIRLGINPDTLLDSGIEPNRFVASILEIAHHVREGQLPGAVLMMDSFSGDVMPIAVGNMMTHPEQHEAEWATYYELGSVTGMVVAVPLALHALDKDAFELRTTLVEFFPDMADHPAAKVTVEELMRHTSGFTPYHRFPYDVRTREDIIKFIRSHHPDPELKGTVTHSQINLLYLGLILEEAFGVPPQEYAMESYIKPLGMMNTMNDLPDHFRERCAPGSMSEWHGRMTWGEPASPSAYILGSTAVNGGLISTADDLAVFSRALMVVTSSGVNDFISSETMAMSFEPTDDSALGKNQGLGWALNGFGPGSFGWNCSVGTSVWIQPEDSMYAIMLSNAFHPKKVVSVPKRDCRTMVFEHLYKAIMRDENSISLPGFPKRNQRDQQKSNRGFAVANSE